MSTTKTNTAQKYDDIRSSYKKWTDKKYKGVRIYSDSYILLKLSEQYYLSSRTIENIVFHRVGYSQSIQGNLFE